MNPIVILSGVEGCIRISSNNPTIKKGLDSAQPDVTFRPFNTGNKKATDFTDVTNNLLKKSA